LVKTLLLGRNLVAFWVFLSSSGMAAVSDQARINAVSPALAEARTAATQGNTEEAIQKYREAIHKTPDDAGLDLEFSRYLASAEQYPEAIGMYERCLHLAPRREEAELGLAEAYRRVHNQDAARSVLRTARSHHPRSVAVLRAIGSMEIDAEANDAAIEALREAVTIAPKDAGLQLLLATAYLGKGQKEAALAELEKVLGHKPADATALFLRGQIYADKNENEKARVDAERVFLSQPASGKARNLLAKVLVRLKDCQQAVNLLRPADNLPLDTEGLFLLGNAYDCAGQTDAAKHAREEFATASENERRRKENELQSKHLYEQANELARQNRFSEALDLLKQALEKNAENGFAYSQQAKIFFSMHDIEKARSAIGKALAIQPYQPDFLYVEGVIAESEGREAEAVAAFEQVTEVNPKEADAYYEMGRLLMKLNDRSRALAAFRRAAELEPDDRDYQRALKAASSGSAPEP
jgi:superkiller protein 3